MILLVLFSIVTDTLNSPLDAYVCLSVSNLLYSVGGVPSPKSYFKYVKLDMPPGGVTVRVISSSKFPMVKCVFNMGDLINRRIYTRTANLSLAEPMLLNFTYLTLGGDASWRHI
jgi:hypothetical protein